jgi:hypothetical protein
MPSGGGQPAQTTQVSKVELPAWVDQASQENYGFAKSVADRPLQQYGGQTVADPSKMTTQGYGLLQSGVGAEDPYFGRASDLYGQAGSPLDVSKYLNPYTNEVEQRAIGNANTALTQQLRSVDDSAQKASAFGGSRQAVESGVTRAEGVRGIGDLSAQLRKQGFDTATQAALADRAGIRDTAAGLTNLAGGAQNSRMTDIQGLLTSGRQDQAQSQAIIDSAMRQFQERQDYPIQQLNMRLAALGMSPYGKTETSNKTSTSEDKGPDWATIGLGGLKVLPSLMAMSDRNTKTDITKLTDGDVPMYSYRYKGDPKTYPKIVGPMAQDVEKKFPSAVKKIGKYKTIDYSNLMEVLS